MSRWLTIGLAFAVVVGGATVNVACRAAGVEGPGSRAAQPGHPVIFVGLDGADWTLLDEYIARGVMPNLAGLVAQGTSGRLTTIQPSLSPLIWTTMMTGVSPLEHGILDFVQLDPQTGQKHPISSVERRAPAIWNMATSAGKRVGVFGLWATYPAEHVNGVMVSDRLFTFLFKEEAPPVGVTWPSDRDGWARDALTRAETGVGLDALKRYLPWLTEVDDERARANAGDPYGHPVSALRRILTETAVYRDLSLDWITHERPDLAVTYFQGTDTIGHVFAPYAPPRQAAITEAEYAQYHDVPERYFRAIDDVLGQYRRAAEANGAVLMLASDHGFQWGEGRPTKLSSVATATAARWHTSRGIYLLWGPGVRAAPGHEHAGSVTDVCATLLALLGLPPGRDVDGAPLPGAAPVQAPRADYFASYRPPLAVSPANRETMDKDALANLRSLGYIGASEGNRVRASGSTRSPGSFNNEGVILKERGKLTQAIEAFEKALALDPALPSALWNLSDILYAKGQDLDRSDQMLVQAFAGGMPDGVATVIGRAIGYQRSGHVDRSLNLVTTASAAKPNEPELWLFRGRYRVETGDCAGASADFERALRLGPQSPAAHSSLGLARLCLGDRNGARHEFERSLELDPGQPKVREYLSKVR